MHFTDDSLFPECQEKAVITCAPYGPEWEPDDAPGDIPLTMEEHVQKAVDCYEAGATVLHIHVRELDGKGSKRLSKFNELLEGLREAVPDMILQVGGSISFAPEGEGAKAKWLSDDTRHMLAELDPKPEQVTIALNTNQMNIMEVMTEDGIRGTSFERPELAQTYREMDVPAGPAWVEEHLRRLRANGIQPHFQLANVSQLETVERLIRKGAYMGPLNVTWVAIGGGFDGPNPYNMGDRVGRSRSVIAMAVVWSVATFASGLAASYGQVLVARFVVGVGGAAYGSIGLAVLLSVFSPARRSTLTATFLAGALVGSVFGVVVGGAAAQAVGWRAAFVVLGVVGLVLTGFYAVAVIEPRIRAHAHPADDVHAAAEGATRRATFATLVSTPAVHAAYIASGLQLLTVGALYTWLPSFLDRAYGLPTAKASGAAGLFIGVIAVGMVTTGALTDRVSARHPIRKWAASAGFVALGAIGLGVAFRMPSGPAQLVVLGIGAFFCAGIAGPAGAMVASLTSPSVRATAFVILSLANNLLGLAAGPVVVGYLADRTDLVTALGLVPFVSIVVLLSLAVGRLTYERSLASVGARHVRDAVGATPPAPVAESGPTPEVRP